jgi:ArsR family transcriptional regulator, zinc-responsive transcriptional repressor
MIKAKREKKPLSAEQLNAAVECLKAMAHPQRLKMLQLVSQARYTVGELATACGIAHPVASLQLRLLERSGLLIGKREGKFVYYQLAEPELANLITIIESRFRDT